MLTFLQPPKVNGGKRPGAGRKPLPIGGPRDIEILKTAIRLSSVETIDELFSFARRGNLGALQKLAKLFDRARSEVLIREGKRPPRRKASDAAQTALFE